MTVRHGEYSLSKGETMSKNPEGTESQTAVLKPQQVQRLRSLIQFANDAQGAVMTYTRSIADGLGIGDYVKTQLDSDKGTLSFIFKDS
jgi:hypothetical protein